MSSIHERPNIQLAQNPIGHVGAHSLSVELLFIDQPVLGSGLDARPLHALDGLTQHDALKIRIRSEALPVTASFDVLAESSSTCAELVVYAQLLRFSTKKSTSFAYKINIPGAGGMDGRGEGSYSLHITDTEGPVFM